jgi:hypothetical protein
MLRRFIRQSVIVIAWPSGLEGRNIIRDNLHLRISFAFKWLFHCLPWLCVVNMWGRTRKLWRCLLQCCHLSAGKEHLSRTSIVSLINEFHRGLWNHWWLQGKSCLSCRLINLSLKTLAQPLTQHRQIVDMWRFSDKSLICSSSYTFLT